MRLNLLEEHARERIGAIPDWCVHTWEHVERPHSSQGSAYKLTGCVAPMRKDGEGRDWKRKVPGTTEVVYITHSEHEAWCEAWQARTGKCWRCTGEGTVFKRWERDQGTEYRPCQACSGTGKVQP